MTGLGRLVIAVSFIISACATDHAAITVQRGWAGTYEAESIAPRSKPTAIAGFVMEVMPFQLVREGANIDATSGTRFGIQYRFTGVQSGTPIRHRVVTRFPEGGLTNPLTHRKAAFDESEKVCFSDEDCYHGQVLRQAWELAPGTWTMEVWLDGKLVLSQAFLVSVR